MVQRDKKLFRFLEWKVYDDTQNVFRGVLEVVRKLPPDIRYSLGSQVIRSGLSIILNIAEGSGRGTDRELNRFFNIAIGSVNETVAALDTLMKNRYLSEENFEAFLENLESVSRQLGGFKKKL